MRNIKLTLSYHGKYFFGWQKQKDTPETVQETLENSIKKFTGENIKITGSGRTDSGVHAIAQTANFFTTSKLPLTAFIYGLNSILPKGVVILNAEEADENFNARKSAKKKTYLYKIYNDKIISPIDEEFYYLYKYKLNIEKMKKASEYLIGEHDFKAFAASQNSTQTTVRKIYDIKWKHEGKKICFEITGNGFLMKMVRNIAGTLIEIGNEKKNSEDIVFILNSRNRKNAGHTAPPQGLYLKEVFYDRLF